MKYDAMIQVRHAHAPTRESFEDDLLNEKARKRNDAIITLAV